MEIEKTGYNINNKIDVVATGRKYIDYFYYNWNNNILKLIEDNFIKDYTKFQYKDNTYCSQQFIDFLISSQNNNILSKMKIKEIQIMPSGSRRMDILVSGIMMDDNKITSAFTQYFLIVSEPKSPENWFLQNTILNEINL
tara:strand:- start:41 stop:460 length:420 start_codon:yes stop_codon:yes gene_type:complete